jgi:hypothetical protein
MLISLHIAETLQHIVYVRQSIKGRKSGAVQERGYLNIINFPTLLCVCVFFINGASIELKMEISLFHRAFLFIKLPSPTHALFYIILYSFLSYVKIP